MYLKSLVLKGFKSFADRSVLRLEPGMTVVVGPNGSGKSNVSDAVLWVLGEQSAKQLRGQAMEDVIFAGSSARQAVSLAEVDLVLDNSDGTLPLDFNEVVITRRMYRSGDSEYLINGSPSRLMDILDVLNDSGLGRDAHSIISQGALQSLLQSRPEDRRVLIEEAAGILKHKKRKERAAKKLRNMDAELERVNDIAAEIDRQLRPLERQASRARQYEQLAGELKEVNLTLAVDDLRSLQREWEALELREKEADAGVELVRYRLDERNRELEKLQRLLEEKGLFVGDLAEQRRRCQMVLAQLDSSMLLLEEKGRNMVTRLSELRQTIHQSERGLTESRERLERASVEQVEAEASLKTVQGQVSEASISLEETRKQRKSQDIELGHLNGALRSHERQIDELTLQVLKATESLATADVEDDLLKRRVQQIDDSFGATQATLAARRSRIGELEERLEGLQHESALAKSDIDKRVRLVDDARRVVGDKRDAVAELQAELKGLKEVDRAFDDASPLLSRALAQRAEGDGIVAPLSELLRAPAELEHLVELLLGEDLFGLATQDTASALKLAERLLAGDEEGGELTLVPLEGCANVQDVCASGTRLLELLDVEPRHAAMAEVLLGDVYLADSLESALSAVHSGSGARFVTREGVVVWPSGKICIGQPSADTEGVLARKRRIAALGQEIPAAQAAVEAALEELSLAESRLQLAQADDFELSQSIAQLNGERDSLREEVGRLEASITGLMQEREEISLRREKVARETEETRQRVAELQERKEQLAEERVQLEEQAAASKEQRTGLFQEETAATTRIQQLQVELATIRERERHLRSTCESSTRTIQQLEEQLEVSHQTEHNLEILRLRVEPLYQLFTELRDVVREKAEMLRDRAQLEQAGQGDLRNTIEEARRAAQEQQAQLDEASEGLVQVRIEKSKLEVRVEQAIKVITQENGVLLDIALEMPAPEDRAELEQRRDRLSKRIKGLGSVNPVAVEEYRKLKERRDFIAIQVEDLEGAAKALDRIVAAIDRKMRNRFMETFNQVNANFQEIIQSLFPGGQGHLELTDPENPETTGVEVHAQPRGKAVRKQSLLSGGEQSLVSLALMFAVYRVNNTPFYILDEVEAALDDTNLRRLLSYLDSIRESTQVIMISHQRRTMEMADLLYGVSMRSDGVSKLVSQKLDQAIRSASGPNAARDVESFSGAQ
ncbi:MAG: chromosome segregation protein SMC [Coriobacteriales bacterium]